MSPFSLAAFQSQVVCFCSDSCIKSIFCAKPSDVIQILLAQKDASKTEKNSFRVSFYSRCKHTAVLQWCNVRFSGAIILTLSQFAWFCLHSSDATESKWVCPFSPRKWVWMGRWDIVSKTSLAFLMSNFKFNSFCIFLHFPVLFRVSPCISISSPSAPAPASKPKENKNSAT